MRLFISYAHADTAIVKDWIVDKLISGGHVVWFDDRLIAGQEWQTQLEEEIKQSDALVYCMTPEAINSEWCKWELAKAVELEKPVVSVLMQSGTDLPDELAKLHYVDFTNGATGDAVARLMRGLRELLPTQIPSAPINPKGLPAQAMNNNLPNETSAKDKKSPSRIEQVILGLTFISTIAAVLALLPIFFSNEQPQPTAQSTVLSTPSTPVVIAQRNLDIRSGPNTGYDLIGILETGDTIDILGILDDSSWYQVLLADGTYGWVLASESFSRFYGSRSVLRIVTPTSTPTNTPTSTPTITPSFTPTMTETATNAPTATNTLTPTPTYSSTPTVTNTPTMTLTPTPTNTNTTVPTTLVATELPTNTATIINTSQNSASVTPTILIVAGQYPCTGTINGNGTTALRIIYNRANPQLSPIGSIVPSSIVTILDKTIANGRIWYQIVYNEGLNEGWIWDVYIALSSDCP